MLAALVVPHVDDIVLDRQPTTMEVIGYQRVQHALADGTPDLKASNNFYIRTRTQWFLVLDTDTLPIDGNGNRHVKLLPQKNRTYRKIEETGRIRGKLASMFTEVGAPDRRERGKTVVKGEDSSGGLEFDRPAKQRLLYWRVRSIAERVETHTEGRRRETRTLKETHWGVSSVGWHPGKPFIPEREPHAIFEARPHVQVDPPTFGFGAVGFPADDDF